MSREHGALVIIVITYYNIKTWIFDQPYPKVHLGRAWRSKRCPGLVLLTAPNNLFANISIRNSILHARVCAARRVNQLIHGVDHVGSHARTHARSSSNWQHATGSCMPAHACRSMHACTCQQQQHACMQAGSCTPAHACRLMHASCC